MFTEQPISQSEKNDNSDLSKDKTSESEAQSKNEKLIEQNKNPEIKPPIPPIQTPESESPPESSHTREEKNEDPPNLDPIDGSFVEEIIDIENLVKEDEYSLEHRSFMEGRYAETMKIFRSGELVKGKIVTINENGVAVDIGFKSEGSIPLDEFDNPENLNIGDEIEVCIDRIEDGKGLLALSKRKAEFYRIWEKINELYKSGEMIEAEITRRIKGGMVVDLFGIEAFLPGSQIDVHPVRDFDALVNAKMDFRIIKVNNDRKNVVLSHKVLVEESLREIREKVLSELEEGQVVEGVVKNITDFGVFVDLGGVDGLLHITDLSWGRVSHPSDVVNLDEKISVKVLNYDKEKQRISLGLKQLKEHHWEDIEKNYPINSKTKGKVVSIVKYGAFIELAEGVEGLVHISEMSWTQHIKHPSQLVNVADEIDIIVLNIDRDNRKISLGMKQVEEDPWEKLEQIYQPKTRHKGIVRDLVPFGAFVELEEGIDGLIHISDLSWTRKVRHPGEIVKKAQEIEIVVLNFDKNERRIALGYKQLIDDPWDSFEKAYPIRAHSEGSVIRVLEKGVVVMLSLGVEGFVP
nr:30S ribosomal protein S1 [candidate division KSB1 bacterium]